MLQNIDLTDVPKDISLIQNNSNFIYLTLHCQFNKWNIKSKTNIVSKIKM